MTERLESGGAVAAAAPVVHGRGAVVDADVHPAPRRREELKRYLPTRFHAYFDQVPGREIYMPATIGARQMRTTFRDDTFPARGGSPGSDYELLCAQLLDRYDVTHAILDPLEQIGVVAYGEFGAAVASAINDWLLSEWLERDDRLRGSIVVSVEDGDRAAKEIERMAATRRFVQVLLLLPTAEPPGHTKYWPIYEAAEDAGLPVAFHPGGFSGLFTGAGTPTYFFEFHVALPFAYATAVVSLVHSGVLTRLPGLQIVLQEGAISWMVPLMARLDRAYDVLRPHVPHLTEPPSSLIRRHFWFTTQPVEEPDRPRDLARVLEALQMDDRIMFASDYPHWDFDAPDRAFPSALAASLRRRILGTNAAALYDLEPEARR